MINLLRKLFIKMSFPVNSIGKTEVKPAVSTQPKATPVKTEPTVKAEVPKIEKKPTPAVKKTDSTKKPGRPKSATPKKTGNKSNPTKN